MKISQKSAPAPAEKNRKPALKSRASAGKRGAKPALKSAQKLHLENLIFARAFLLGAPVDAVRGGLKTPSADALLQGLIFYYNVFFRLGYDPNANTCETYRTFLRARTRRPFFKFAGVPVLAQDILPEIYYEQ